MNTEYYYRQVATFIAGRQFESLRKLKIVKPPYFNWAAEVFENIHVKETPNESALIWTDAGRTSIFSFVEMSLQCNRLLNFLRKNNLQQHQLLSSNNICLKI